MGVIKACIYIEPHSAHLGLRKCLVFFLMEVAGRIKHTFTIEGLVHESQLQSDAQCPPEQLLFIGVLSTHMRILV